MSGLSTVAKWLNEVARRAVERGARNTGNIERLERVVKDMPHTVEIFSPEAGYGLVAEHPEGFIKPISPADFRTLAQPLSRGHAEPYVEHYKNLLRDRRWSEPPEGLFLEHYLNTVRNQPFEGFSSMPRIWYEPSLSGTDLLGHTSGHEGRHRAYVIEDLYGPDIPIPTGFYGPEKAARVPFALIPEAGGRSVDMPYKKYAAGGLTQAIDDFERGA